MNRVVILALTCSLGTGLVSGASVSVQGRMVGWTFESRKTYADPFNDVDVDVVFERDGARWRVPTFWRGGSRWTVRFAPPQPGEYRFHLESTDRSNPDLNGHDGHISFIPPKPHSGTNAVLEHGMIRVSANGRYFEYADGTPFYWLADTWWAGASNRLPWKGFQTLTQDRRQKGFTVVQICGGLVPDEAHPPTDPGFCNEGGCAWETKFERINPRYFDYADRRIEHLLDHGLVPAIVGGWNPVLAPMGIRKTEQHWRYLIARYGAYPVFWIAGGEVYDPPPAEERKSLEVGGRSIDVRVPGWTEVVRYLRATDPYHHPVTVHELPPPFDSAIQDESLTDFDIFQISHEGWAGIPTEIALLNKHYARTTVRKPLVVGEIGYEGLGATHWQDFQRAAFWLAMLNGAAGYSYGTVATMLSYSAEQPLHPGKQSFMTWQEGMALPGSYQIGLGAGLLRHHAWWQLQPHPEWVSPHGTTLLEPNSQITGFDIDLFAAAQSERPPPIEELPLGEWHQAHGNWRLPYAAGIPGELRVIYLPYFGYGGGPAITVQGLEHGVRYHAYYWEPALGMRVDLGVIERGEGEGAGTIDLSHQDRRLYDARGGYRGQLKGAPWSFFHGQISGPGWSEYGKHQRVQGDTYQPEHPPTIGDWLLILDTQG